MAELSSLVFATDTTELERASRAIASLVQDMSQISVASANMARISAQTEAILARAATESAKARKENAKAADIEIKTVIAADKADAARAESISKAAEAERRRTEATEESTRATRSNVDILQRQNDIYEFLAEGFSKGQASILATAKAAGQLSDELKGVLEAQKQFTSDSFDQSETGLKRLMKTTREVTAANGFFLEGFDLTTKQARELSNDLDRLNASLTAQGKSYQEITNAQSIYKQQFIDEAAVVNRANAALDTITKQRREVVSATDYMTTAEQKMAAALNTSNAAIDRSGTDLLVKYEAALRKSGVAQDVATQKLAAYKAQLAQVQIQEDKRRADHLTRSLPAQATDIAVSLWSGQNPLTVLLQQGGQINDMFMQSGVAAEDFAKVVRASLASMVPAMWTVAKGIGEVIADIFVDSTTSVLDFVGAITGVTDAIETAKRWMVSLGEANFHWIGTIQRLGALLIGVLAAGLAASAAAAVGLVVGLSQVIKEEDNLASALARSGGSLNLSHTAAIEYAKSMGGVGVTTGEAIEVITAMAEAGNFLAKEIKMVVLSAVEMEKYAGVAVEDTVKQFSKLKEKPVEAILELAKTTGMIAPEVIKAVTELEDQGKTADAVARAMTALSDVNTEKVKRMKEDFSSLSLAIISLKDNFSSLFAGMFKSMFYKDNPITELRKKIAEQEEQNIKTIATKGEDYFRLPEMEAQLNNLREQLHTVMKTNLAREQGTAANIAGAKAEKAAFDLQNKYDGVVAKAKKEIVKLEAQRTEFTKAGTLSRELDLALTQGIAAENKKIADELKKNAPKGDKKLDSFYDDAMKKFRDATIEANDATNELTKSQVTLMEKIADPKFAKLSEQKKNDILQAGAAAIAIEKQKEAVIDLQKAEEFRDKILGKSEGLGKDYYAQMDALPKHAANLKLTTEQTDELIRKIYQGTPVWQQYKKSLDQVDEALRKFNESSIAYQASTNAENQELNHRISLLGKTAEEQRKLQIEYQREMKINAARVELEKKLREIAKDKAKAEKDGITDTGKLQEFADAEVQARQDAAERIKVINKGVAVEYASDLDKEIRAVQQSISDSIVTALFEGGKEGSKKLRSVLVDTLRKKVTIFVDAVVNTLTGSVIGSIAGGLGVGQAGSSALGMVGDASSLLSTGSALSSLGAFGGAVSGFGTAALAATQSMLGITGTAAQMTTSLAAAGHTAASGLAAGVQAFQAIPGWGWALAGIGLLAGMMDFGGEQRFGGGYQLNGNKEVKYTAGPGGGQINQEAQEQVATGTYQSINAILKSLDSKLEVVDFYAGLETSGKGKGGTFAGGQLSSGIEFGKKWTAGMYSQNLSAEEAVNQFAGQMKIVTVEALKAATDIPVYLQDELKKVDVTKLTGDTAGLVLEETNRMYTLFSTVKGALELLNKPMFDTTTAGYALTETFIEMFGGIEGLKTSVSSYYDNFYSEAEKELNIRNQLTAALDEQNLALPKTRDEYRNLVEAQDLTTEAGRKNYAVLLKNAGAFAELTPATEAANKQIAGINKLFKGLNIDGNLVETKFSAATEEMFESLGVSVQEYSSSIGDVISGILTGATGAEEAGTALANAAVGGINNAIAQAGSDAIAAQFVNSVITPILDNISAGRAALDGVDVEGALNKANQDALDLKTALNTIGDELGGGIKGLAETLLDAGTTAGRQIGTASLFAGGAGESRFVIGGSAVSDRGYQPPELEAFNKLANETIESNKKVSELLQKLLNPKKEYANRYLELADKLIDKQKEYNVEGRKNEIEAMKLRVDDIKAVNAVVNPLIESIKTGYHSIAYGMSNKTGEFDKLADIIIARGQYDQTTGLIKYGTTGAASYAGIVGANGGTSQDVVSNFLESFFAEQNEAGNPQLFFDYLKSFLNVGDVRGRDLLTDADVLEATANLTKLEKELREWYIAQARVIAVEDLSANLEETAIAKSKTAELKRTGGLEDPVTKLKESLVSKMRGIDEGIGAALLAEVEALKTQTPEANALDLLKRDALAKAENLKKYSADGAIEKYQSQLEYAVQSSYDSMMSWNGESSADHYQSMGEALAHYSALLQQVKNGSFLAGLENASADAEQAVLDALLAATDPAKQQALLDEIAKYKGGITEWYKAQAELLSTEMLVDINNQIKELEASEKGPLTTIKDAIQKYIDDFKALGTLTEDIQTQIDKLSGLQLTKARKSLYDQLLSPDEVKLRDSYDLNIEFAKLGKTVPITTQGLRDMIDAANAAGNVTLADSLLELVPAFLALQEGAEGVSAVLDGLRSDTDEAYAALERAVEAQRKVLDETIANLKAVFDAAKNAAKTLYGEVDSVKKQSAAAGNAFINQALQELKSTGIIPDGIKLQDAIDSAMKGLSSEVYESSFEEQRGRLILAGKLTTIADLTEPQLTVAEKQLKDLDAILENARKQIDELRGINNSVLSVADAMTALAAAIAAEKATVPPVIVPPVIVPPGGGGGGGGTTSLDAWGKQLLDKNAATFASDNFKNATADQLAALKSGSTGSNIYLTADAALEALKAAPADSLTAAGLVRRELTLAKNSGLSMDDRTAYAYGKISAEDLLKKYDIKLPGFAVGINQVPYDMPANLHKNEAIIPARFNPFNPTATAPLSLGVSGARSTDNSDIIEENKLLRQELQAQNGAMVRLLSKVARVVERWDGDGLPEPRTETA